MGAFIPIPTNPNKPNIFCAVIGEIMFHCTRRFLNAALAVLVVFTLLLGFVKPVFAEGEVPEDAPPAAAPAPEGEESPETLAQALSDGSAAVADGGAVVPLASQSELDESCVPDPYFYSASCPSGICNYTTINDALANWGAFKGVGYIYLDETYQRIAGDGYLGINGAPGFNPEYQTLKGIVWDGIGARPILEGSLTVRNLLGGFLLQGFSIDGQVLFDSNKGTIKLDNMTLDPEVNIGSGLQVKNHNGSVTLNQVRVVDSRNTGVYINNVNLPGAATGAVTLSNVTILNTFGQTDLNPPTYAALYIRSNSPISINGLFIKETDGGGALILPGKSTVTIKNGYIGFSRDFTATTTYKGFGLKISGGDDPAGTITLDNLRLYDNQSDGVLIGNAGVVKLNNVYSSGNSDCVDSEDTRICHQGYGLHLGDRDNPDTAKSLTITNSQFNWNGLGGAMVVMAGPVSISNTEISGSQGEDSFGLYLDNKFLSGAAVTITGVRANDNKQNGITILTRGSATLTNIEAYNNRGGRGADIDASAGVGMVTINTSIFNDNYQGLSVMSQKNITLKLVEASNNEDYGAWLQNNSGTGNVTLLGLGTSGNNFHKNRGAGVAGLNIVSSGTVSVTNVSTDGNSGSGVYIDNSTGLGGVSVLSASPLWMNNFSGSQGGSGLQIYSKGNIKLVNVSAWDNSVDGVSLDNCIDGPCLGSGSITISTLGTGMVNNFSNNKLGSGLFAESFGSITLTNVEASRNGFMGVWVMNDQDNTLGTESTGNITLTNLTSRDFSENGFAGLYATSYGSITVKGVNAFNNPFYGAYLGSLPDGAGKTVSVSNSTFNDTKDGKGLFILSKGPVKLSSVSANGNDLVDGVIGLWQSVGEKISWNRQGQPDTWNYQESTASHTVAGWLSSNDFTVALTIFDVTDAEQVTFDSADGYFWFDTEFGHEYLLEISGVEAEYRGKYSFELYEFIDNGAGQPQDLGKVFPNDGLGGTGIWIDNKWGTAGVTITNPVTSKGQLQNNSGDGLFIHSNGAVTVNNLNANDNGNMGVNITTNYYDTAIPATVNLSGLETNWNGAHGVGVQTLGSIMYSTSTSGGNGYYAAYLDNCRPDGLGGCEATVMKPVTLSKLNFDNNRYGPAVVNSFGNITAGGIKSQWNGGSGLALFNDYDGSTGTVTLLGTLGQNVFHGNQLAGMRIYSNGSVTLSNFWVKDNGTTYVADAYDPEAMSAGMYISAGGNVMLSGGTVESNVRSGILINANNSVTMSKLIVMNNGWNWVEWNDKSGIEIYANGVSPVSITSSLIFGNAKHAILIHDAVSAPLLTGTVFFGNDLDGSGDADVEY